MLSGKIRIQHHVAVLCLVQFVTRVQQALKEFGDLGPR
jgi:hypothetical protein